MEFTRRVTPEPRAPARAAAWSRGVDRALVTKRPGCDAYPAGVQPRLRDPWDVRIRLRSRTTSVAYRMAYVHR